MKESAILAIKNGLIAIAPEGKPFRSRNGSDKTYLIDSRGAGTNIELREIIVSEMELCLKKLNNYDIIGGIAKSGTTWGAWLSWKLRIPYANILLDGKRSSGLQREIEGDVKDKNVVLIDNWLRSGTSILNAAEVVRRNGGNAIGAIVITKLKEVDLTPIVFPAWELRVLFEAAIQTKLVPDNFNFK